jgi:hypothetical protein
MQIYLFARWIKAVKMNRSKLPPNFQESINETMDCVERVLARRDLRRLVDLQIAFDSET